MRPAWEGPKRGEFYLQLNLTIIRKWGILTPMIICICNRIAESEVHSAIAKGARRAEEVHACCGADVDCGSCLKMIDDIMDQACMASTPQLQAAG